MPSNRIVATALALLALTPAAAQADQIDISVLSSRADQVSGGDALVRVDAPPGLLDKLGVQRNGTDVTDAFYARGDGLVGPRRRPAARQERAHRHGTTGARRRLRQRA